jgi:methionyl-tRNA synthetase
MTQREILVTHALPYANGPLHIGHLLGYIQTDIWVRAMRMAGNTVHFVAADDVHGTPIMLAAEKAGKTPEDFIGEMLISHKADFKAFAVDHDYYYTTHSPENRELAEFVYTRLRDAKPESHIARRAVRQFYDPLKQMFLPDRYIKGECPNCGTPDQYGDNCENCGATYAPTDLKNPRSVVSGATPELRDSEHYFFKVGDFAEHLRRWLGGELTGGKATMHPSVAAKLREWLDAEGGVRDWDISRDAPYFGFEIPGTDGKKFFYVWLDAPIGYLASFKKYCASAEGAKNGLKASDFDRFLRKDDPRFDASAEMHHFIGKDIVNFHGLFWPAMLEGAGLRTPNALHVNGYLTVNGEKMSKSRGTFIQARTYLDSGLNPDYLRYYFATMLSAAPTDVDLDLKAFEERVNSHLVGKWVNIASRCAGFVTQHFDGILADTLPEQEQQAYLAAAKKLSAAIDLYAKAEFAGVTRLIMEVADEANMYVAGKAPWLLAKDASKRAELHTVCTLALNYFRLIAIYLYPIAPDSAQKAKAYSGQVWQHFSAADQPLLGASISPYAHLMTRVDAKKIDSMIEASKESLQTGAQAGSSPSPQPLPPQGGGAKARSSGAPGAENAQREAGARSSTSPLVGEVAARSAAGEGASSAKPNSGPQPSALSPALIGIDDFAKLDLRVGKVLQCGFVDGSDKLLRFELDAGELGKRQIFSGIRASYQEPEKLIGRNVVFIANLAPRKMRFGVSEGMILSAGGDDGLFLLDADEGARPGMAVK